MRAEPNSRDRAPLDDLRRINEICDKFEAQWVAGGRPAISDYLLQAAEALRTRLVRDLIDIEWFYRFRQCESPQVDAYLEQFPEVDAAWLKELGAGSREQGTRARCSLLPARHFGAYELLSEVARGGMGVVYKARQASLNRIVAVKLILSGLHAAPADVERFYAEAEAAALLDHPGIVPIFDVGEYQGRHYISMGYVDGRSLADRLTEGPLAARAAAELVRTVCDAVQYAHERNVIHRDLKPGNILLDRDGRPRITDFGLAKCLTDDAGRTATGQMLGTPSFMPPEQAAGKLDLIGPASDVYALGAILYTLLTGRPPFQAASSIDTLRQVIDNEPVRPSDLAPGTPRDLETIALKCLQKPTRERYASVRDLGEDLQRFLDGRAIVARPVSRWERGWRWCRRNPYMAALGGTVALLAVISTAAALAAFSLSESRRVQLARAEKATQAETAAKQVALIAKENESEKLWGSYLAAARAGRMSRQPGQRFASLRAINAALALPVPKGRSRDELRTEAIAALLLPDLEPMEQWPREAKNVLAATVDAAFHRYARGDDEGRVSIRRVSDDAELLQLPGDGPPPEYRAMAFSSSGRYFMQAREMRKKVTRRIWDLQRPSKPVLTCNAAYDFSPDGRRLATVENDGSIGVYDLATGKRQIHPKPAGFVADLIAWNPRRSTLLVNKIKDKSYRLLDLETGAYSRSISVSFEIVNAVWHPEGRILAMVDADPSLHPKIHLVVAETGAPYAPPLESQRAPDAILRFNGAGDRLMATDWSGLWRLWDVRTGQLLLTQPGGGNELRFSDDDRMAGIAGDKQRIWLFRFESGREFTKIVRLGPAGSRIANPDFGSCQLDPEGRLLALIIVGGTAIFDAVRGEETAFFRAGGSPFGVDGSGALFTHGPAGLRRWPLTLDKTTGSRVYGPPERLAAPLGHMEGGQGCAACKGVMVFPDFNFGAIELLLPEKRQIELKPQEDVRRCAVSRDGRWVATGSHGALKGPCAKIWDAKTGHFARDLPVSRFCSVKFSPDGKWLLTSGGGARLWSVGNWSEGPKLPASADFGVFSQSGDLLALNDVPGVVRLVSPADGREIAQLTAPEPVRLWPYFFTRDQNRLICWAEDDESLVIFDLGLIRRQLDTLGLDWDAQPGPIESDRLPEPAEVKFIGAE
jgi:eukaryotic-like serine/threonine-protein kinase